MYLFTFRDQMILIRAYSVLITFRAYPFTYANTYFGRQYPGLISNCLLRLLLLIPLISA